jgi:hypothetical protein
MIAAFFGRGRDGCFVFPDLGFPAYQMRSAPDSKLLTGCAIQGKHNNSGMNGFTEWR